MGANWSTLEGAARAARELVRRAHRRPLDHWVPLPGQYAVLTAPDKYRLFRAGNQTLGKTTCGAVDLICTATGVHPWCPAAVTPGPIEAWVICAAWPQSVAIQRKVWELLPKDLLHPETVFDEIRGFRGKNPAFRIRHVPSNGWSIVRFKTTQQGGLNLAGATIVFAWFDEPPHDPRVFSEVSKRVTKAGRYGRVLLTMTPVNAPVEWIREATLPGEDGSSPLILDIHRRLEPQELIPVGRSRPICTADGTPMDEAWIAQQIRETLAHEVPVVIHGEWFFASDSPVFSAFKTSGPLSHVVDVDPDLDWDLYLGLDHGMRRHAQVALLIGVHWPEGRGKGTAPIVHVIDEYVADVETTEDDDAEAILAMLEEHGLSWTSLRAVHGDIPHHGSNRRGSVAKKSNARLERALQRHPRAQLHGIRPRWMSPKIDNAKKGAAAQGGAVDFGCTYLHRLMVRPGHFSIHRRCEHTILSLQKYDMTPNSDESHLVDCMRYGLKPIIYGSRSKLPGRPVFIS